MVPSGDFVVKESCSLIGREVQLTTSNQKWIIPLMIILMRKRYKITIDSFQIY